MSGAGALVIAEAAKKGGEGFTVIMAKPIIGRRTTVTKYGKRRTTTTTTSFEINGWHLLGGVVVGAGICALVLMPKQKTEPGLFDVLGMLGSVPVVIGQGLGLIKRGP